jgi:hypothetical protein
MENSVLIDALRTAFGNKVSAEGTQFRTSNKRHPSEDLRTGHDAAEEYRYKKIFPNSSIRKRQRVARIAEGRRPFCYGVPTRRELYEAKKEERNR